MLHRLVGSSSHKTFAIRVPLGQIDVGVADLFFHVLMQEQIKSMKSTKIRITVIHKPG